MYIETVRLDDFGCFRGATLDDLADGVVVIGGPQRAGKTTFMTALRQLPTGVSQASDIPPATDDYRIDAEVVYEDHRYRYLLSGHAAPSVSPIDGGPEVTSDTIFGPVSARQYTNLYTISLDELQRVPDGLDEEEDLAKVLLGGAYGDIAEIPDLQATFADQAHDIGLSNGNPTYKSGKLNDPYKQIQSGLEQRREANEQVTEHRSVTKELEETRAEIETYESELESLERTRERLEILGELLDPIQELTALEARLADVDETAVTDFPTSLVEYVSDVEAQFRTADQELQEARQAFESSIDCEIGDTSLEEYQTWLLDEQATVDEFGATRRKWGSEVSDLVDTQDRLATRRQELERTVSELHSDWPASFEPIDDIETGAVDVAGIRDLCNRWTSLREKREDLAAKLDRKQAEKTTLEAQLAEMDDASGSPGTQSFLVPALVAASGVVVATAVGVAVTPVVGAITGLAVVVLGFGIVQTLLDPSIDIEPYRETKGKLTSVEGDIEGIETELRGSVEPAHSDLERELEGAVADIGLPTDLPYSEVAPFYERVVEVDREIAQYRDDHERWERAREDLVSELEPVADTLEAITNVEWDPADPLTNAARLLDTIQALENDLERARAVRRAKRERDDAIESINNALATWDESATVSSAADAEDVLGAIARFEEAAEEMTRRAEEIERRDQLRQRIDDRMEAASAQRAFEDRRDDESWRQVVREAAEDFADETAIDSTLADVEREIENIENRLEKLGETATELQREREALASEADLRAAQATIDEGRVEFERLGEAYAVNRIAESMVEQLHDRLLADVVESLEADASAIFEAVTQEYTGIDLDMDGQSLSFLARRAGKPDHGVNELSRATAEQLFLAIRLARIRQAEVSLPVVIDDATTNFDPAHLSRVIDVIETVAESNQVFLLTCHPECVDIVDTCGVAAQYWELADGKFSQLPTATDLQAALTVDEPV